MDFVFFGRLRWFWEGKRFVMEGWCRCVNVGRTRGEMAFDVLG